MATKDGAKIHQEALAAAAGVSNSVACTMSGADLMQKALAVLGGTTIGAGKDGGRLSQMAGNSKVV